MRKTMVNIIIIYQKFISPLFYSNCRFTPTCSEYAKNSIGKYGILYGGFLSIKRLLRCNPFCNGGIDEVP